MGFFDKKVCSVCGGDAGRVFVKKLEDGILCKECTGKLSPFFSERRHSTVESIKEQLAYREANKAEVAAFEPTASFGNYTKIFIDEPKNKFIVTSASKWRDVNPDVIEFSKVLDVKLDVREDRDELTYENHKGEHVSYEPPRYKISYDYYITISVNHEYFDEINFKLNGSEVEETNVVEQMKYKEQADEIKAYLTNARAQVREAIAAAAAPKTATTCPRCGATGMPDANGCCEYCGGPLA